MEKTYNRVPQWFACGFVLIGLLAGGEEPQRRIALGAAEPGSLYAVTVAMKNPGQLQGNHRVRVAIADARGKVAEKWLHAADLDFYLTLRPRVSGQITVALSAPGTDPIPELETAMHRIPIGRGGPSAIAAAPNDTWQTAQPF